MYFALKIQVDELCYLNNVTLSSLEYIKNYSNFTNCIINIPINKTQPQNCRKDILEFGIGHKKLASAVYIIKKLFFGK